MSKKNPNLSETCNKLSGENSKDCFFCVRNLSQNFVQLEVGLGVFLKGVFQSGSHMSFNPRSNPLQIRRGFLVHSVRIHIIRFFFFRGGREGVGKKSDAIAREFSEVFSQSSGSSSSFHCWRSSEFSSSKFGILSKNNCKMKKDLENISIGKMQRRFHGC